MRLAALAFLAGVLLEQSLAELPALAFGLLVPLFGWLAWRDPRWLIARSLSPAFSGRACAPVSFSRNRCRRRSKART